MRLSAPSKSGRTPDYNTIVISEREYLGREQAGFEDRLTNQVNESKCMQRTEEGTLESDKTVGS